MKYRKALPLVILSIFLTSCTNLSTIKKNQVIIENLNKNNTTSSNKLSTKKTLLEEEAKLKALEVLEKYFNIKLYLTEVDCSVDFHSPEDVNSLIIKFKKAGTQKNDYENSKSIIENGLCYVRFYTKDTLKSSNIEQYELILDAKTGELYSYNYYGNRSQVVIKSANEVQTDYMNKNNITIDEAETVSKDFLNKNNIAGIKNIKTINRTEKKYYDFKLYYFTFEDSESPSRSACIYVASNSKQIFSFSVGLMTTLQFPY